MIFHRAKGAPAPIDIAPGAAARLRLRPARDVVETSRSAPDSPGEAFAPRIVAPHAHESRAALDALTRAYADRDRAIEDAEYLREQLRSTQAYLANVLETEGAAGRAERASLLGELALLEGELRTR